MFVLVMSLFPIRYPDLFKKYKQHLSVFWTPEECPLDKDKFDELTHNEQYFIKNILGFFAGSDILVNDNLACRFYNDTDIPEAKAFYTVQMMFETIHSEQYSLLIDTYIHDRNEREHLFNAIETIPAVASKSLFVKKYIQSDESFSVRLVAFACVEGILFSGSFCAIYWLKERSLLPGLTLSNEFISRDEGLHTAFACELFKTIDGDLQQIVVHTIIREAVELEIEFITKSLPCNLIGMNATLMGQYIMFVADRLSIQLGYRKIYNVHCPFDFMEKISLERKGNFFETRSSEYGKSNVNKSVEEQTFSLTADF
jgi:ribonucleotide reductase beta subunit family protein with ferritin-like domain